MSHDLYMPGLVEDKSGKVGSKSLEGQKWWNYGYWVSGATPVQVGVSAVDNKSLLL